MMNMPDQAARPKNQAPRIGRFVSWLLFGVLLAFLLLITIGAGFFELPILLGIGWARFLARTVPRISLNRDLVGMALLCAATVLSLAHWFLKWLAGQIAASHGKAWNWPWRWTWCGASAMAVVFLVGMAVGGIAHQVGWMASSPESWYERKGAGGLVWSDLKQLRLGLQVAMDDANGDLERARREFKKSEGEYLLPRRGEPTLFEKYACLLIVGESGKLVGAILFPRDPSKWKQSRGLLYWFETQEDFLPMTKLAALLQKHQGHLLAL